MGAIMVDTSRMSHDEFVDTMPTIPAEACTELGHDNDITVVPGLIVAVAVLLGLVAFGSLLAAVLS